MALKKWLKWPLREEEEKGLNKAQIKKMEEITDRNNTEEKPIRDERGLFLPGNPGSPGRPKGKTLKEWARDQLMSMTDEERMKFLKTMPRDIIWKMAEGNPSNETKADITSAGEKITGINFIYPDGYNSTPNDKADTSV